MEQINIQMFNGRTDARLVKVRYDVLPITMGQAVNITNEDSIEITRVDDRAITMEVTRKLVVNPKSLFEISATCFLRRTIGENFKDVQSLKEIDTKALVEQYKNELTNVAFINLSHIIANITASFGGTPILTPPAPAMNASVSTK
ncbi:MAG: hypothetical protein IJA22_02555 [Clostridia bacterium]|nr:hypothetical protein [Clostridia bacterium]